MHRKWEKNAPVPQVTGLRGHVIDPFREGGGVEGDGAPREGRRFSPLRWKFMKQAFVKFKGIDMSILLHLQAGWAPKRQQELIALFLPAPSASISGLPVGAPGCHVRWILRHSLGFC